MSVDFVAATSVRNTAPTCGFVEPVAPAEGDEGEMNDSRLEIWPGQHRDHSPAAPVPDEPSRERPDRPNASLAYAVGPVSG